MKTVYKHYKHSTTGDVISSMSYEETRINFPVCWYRWHVFIGEDMTLPDGYIPISEKTFNRLKRKHFKN